MFINCPFCKALVATNPATDQPPEHCPRCAAKLRDVAVDAPVPAVSLVPQEGQAGVPSLDPDFLLQVPAPDEALVRDAGEAAPSELSSQIRQTVALETATPAAADPGAVAPIAAMLKPTGSEPAPAPAPPDDASHGAKPADPAPAAAPVPTEASPTDTAPPADAPAAEPADAAARPADAGQAEATDAPAADAPDAGADVIEEAAAPAETEVAPDTQAPAPAPDISDADTATAAAEASAAPVPAAQPAAGAAPSFARRRAALGATGLHWKSAAAIAALALLLALQLLLADRDRLAADASWRPLLANVCGVLGCSLPPWREPEAFALLARDVRPHPSKPDVLRVTATFRNDARWPQPWPRVRLTLSDVNGNAVATRDFDARDYLGSAPEQAELRAGQSASVAMEVVESEPRSVAFNFELL